MKIKEMVGLVVAMWAVGCGQNSVQYPTLTYTRDGGCSSLESFAGTIASAEVSFENEAQLRAWKEAGIIMDSGAGSEGLDAKLQMPGEAKKSVKVAAQMVQLGGMPRFRRALYRIQADVDAPSAGDRTIFALIAQDINLDFSIEDMRAGFEIEESYAGGGYSIKGRK